MIFSHYKRFLRFKPLLGIALFIALIIGASFLISNMFSDKDDAIAIILSPHAGDAYLGLGGLISEQGEHAHTVNIFTDTDQASTTLAEGATKGKASVVNLGYTPADAADPTIVTQISQDIQAMIIGNSEKSVSVYAPAFFTDAITPKEHALVYEAFKDVAAQYPDMTVHFYVYEDFPYITTFNFSSVISVQRNIENNFDIRFTRVEIPLTSRVVHSLFKEDTSVFAQSARAYKASRCGENPDIACEVVYKLER